MPMTIAPATTSPRESLAQRIHLWLSLLLGGACVLTAGVVALSVRGAAAHDAIPAALAALLIAAAPLLPVVVRTGSSGTVRITGEAAVLVGAGFVVSPGWLMAALVAGGLAGLAVQRQAGVAQAATALTPVAVSAVLAGAVLWMVSGDASQLTLGRALAVIVAGIVFLAARLITGLALPSAGKAAAPSVAALTEAAPYWVPLLISGALGGLVAVKMPAALPLLAGPLAFIVLASRVQSVAARDRASLDGLLSLATDAHGRTSIADVKRLLSSTAAALIGAPSARVGVPPHGGEMGAPLKTSTSAGLWLCVAPRQRPSRPYTQVDLEQLLRVAEVGQRALDNAARQEMANHAAEHDALTGLINRRAFERALEHALWHEPEATALLFIDLDGFKQVNDQYGHKAGDDVLVETAKRLRVAVRGDDIVARLGGDEFTIILRNCQGRQQAVEVAERVLSLLRGAIALRSGPVVQVSPSIGVARSAQGVGAAQLVRHADEAMYEAKRSGKNCWREQAAA